MHREVSLKSTGGSTNLYHAGNAFRKPNVEGNHNSRGAKLVQTTARGLGTFPSGRRQRPSPARATRLRTDRDEERAFTHEKRRQLERADDAHRGTRRRREREREREKKTRLGKRV